MEILSQLDEVVCRPHFEDVDRFAVFDRFRFEIAATALGELLYRRIIGTVVEDIFDAVAIGIAIFTRRTARRRLIGVIGSSIEAVDDTIAIAIEYTLGRIDDAATA